MGMLPLMRKPIRKDEPEEAKKITIEQNKAMATKITMNQVMGIIGTLSGPIYVANKFAISNSTLELVSAIAFFFSIIWMSWDGFRRKYDTKGYKEYLENIDRRPTGTYAIVIGGFIFIVGLLLSSEIVLWIAEPPYNTPIYGNIISAAGVIIAIFGMLMIAKKYRRK